MKAKIDREIMHELIVYGIGLLMVVYILFGDSFSDNSKIAEVPSNGDTRIERESESEYGEPGYYAEWEETYYNGKWMPTDEYDQIIQVQSDYDYDYSTEENNNVEVSQDELKNNEVLFIYKGYYYHSSIECEGLKDCYDIMKGDISQVKSELGLKPCNWCI